MMVSKKMVRPSPPDVQVLNVHLQVDERGSGAHHSSANPVELTRRLNAATAQQSLGLHDPVYLLGVNVVAVITQCAVAFR